MEDEHKHELNVVTSQLQDKTTEAATVRLDAERLRVSSKLYASDSKYMYVRSTRQHGVNSTLAPNCIHH